MTTYDDFIARKLRTVAPVGIESPEFKSTRLFDFQHDLVRWALRRGRAAIFASTGLGKTRMQLTWADTVARHTGKPTIVLAPLAVADQSVREGTEIGIGCVHARDQSAASGRVVVTNYERLHLFDARAFGGVVLDESSIIKHHDAKTLRILLDTFSRTPFRLCATATPSPNDYTELGTHAEFLGICSRAEMLSEFFCHDGGETQDWRLKGHAREIFWKWVASWGALVRDPSDLGYDGSRYVLPPLRVHEHIQSTAPIDGMLFAEEAKTLSDRRAARRASMSGRAAECADIVNATDDPWVVWCDFNAESEALTKSIRGSVEVRGADDSDVKEERLASFAAGKSRVIVTKPSIAGFGLNWQHASNMAFVGLTDSWEAYFQAVRRCWRFGQKREVNVHIFASEAEGAVLSNVQRKEQAAIIMSMEVARHTKDSVRANIGGARRETNEYAPAKPMRGAGVVLHGDRMNVVDQVVADRYALYHGDSCEVIKGIPDRSVGFSIFSPPFASLYTYSNSPRDLGNCKTHAEFFEHFAWLAPEILRVTKPGRLCSVHSMLLPTSKERDGYIGLSDFRGEIIRSFQRAGWIFHSEVVIWKDPVTAMQRTKALGLLHKTIRKDSSMSRQGIPDYVTTFRAPTKNEDPISHTPEEFPVSLWQRYASPVWMDINPSDTLQRESAREEEDERHICPLQLEVIRRCVRLWTNKNDVVFSPFAGIGSEGYVAIQEGRRFVGIELKGSYYIQAAKNLDAAVKHTTADLFDGVKT